MPWDGTGLVARSPTGAATDAGGEAESVFQPEWDAEGRLHFVSDRDGWWNLYRVAGDGALEQLTAEEADIGHPQWLFGGSTFAFLDGGGIACVRCERGEERLGLLDPGAERVRDLGLPYTSFGFPSLSASGTRVAFAAASPEHETAVVVHDAASGETETIRSSSDEPFDPAYASMPRAIEFTTGGGEEVAHGFFYPPTNPGFKAPEGELPPLIVQSHGGPTSHALPPSTRVQLLDQPRFGVVDVNYRAPAVRAAYRPPARQWGIVDTGLRRRRHALAATGEATANGWRSAGVRRRYATLCALVFHDEFAAGASYYGSPTGPCPRHPQFEARYLDGLIGPIPSEDLYRERSPINYVEGLRAPVILFQGLGTRWCRPTRQSDGGVADQERVPTLTSPSREQHGFQGRDRDPCLEAELYFYGASSASSQPTSGDGAIDCLRLTERVARCHGRARRLRPTGVERDPGTGRR